jgi:hypothetical protein
MPATRIAINTDFFIADLIRDGRILVSTAPVGAATVVVIMALRLVTVVWPKPLSPFGSDSNQIAASPGKNVTVKISKARAARQSIRAPGD